jgi:uncharacterized protein (TIGR00290 family)
MGRAGTEGALRRAGLTVPEQIALGWSGGKDCTLALQRLLLDPAWTVSALLTTVTSGYDRVSVHGVRRELLHRQAETLSLPLREVEIPPDCSNEEYERRMGRALEEMRDEGIRHIAFGDLHLRDVRDYRERLVEGAGMKAVFPLWGEQTAELADRFISDGFQAIVVCVDEEQLAGDFAGRDYDRDLLGDLPDGVDPCGENGEFHTFVHAGPLLREPVAFELGESVLRDDRFRFRDLVPA